MSAGPCGRVVAEVLYGLQSRTEAGIRTWDHFLRQLCDRLRQMQTPTLEVLADPDVFAKLSHVKSTHGVVRTMLMWLDRLGAESERRKDVWDLKTLEAAVANGPFCSVVVKGQKPQFSWNEADVVNWSTKKPYDF